MTEPVGDPEATGQQAATVIGLVFAGLLHLTIGAFTLPVGLVAPPWAALLLNLAWLAFAVLIWRWRRKPLLALLVPFAHAALLAGALSAGDAWLGWTA